MSLLKWAAIAAILAVVAAIFGFAVAASTFATIAKVLLFIFLVGCIILVAMGVFVARKVTGGP